MPLLLLVLLEQMPEVAEVAEELLVFGRFVRNPAMESWLLPPPPLGRFLAAVAMSEWSSSNAVVASDQRRERGVVIRWVGRSEATESEECHGQIIGDGGNNRVVSCDFWGLSDSNDAALSVVAAPV